MLIKYFYDDRLAQASYFVGCPASGTGIVIDPARDIAPYLQAAESHGLHIEFTAETHIHADYVSGTRELSAATGATIILSGEGDPTWDYDFPAGDKVKFVKDNDTFFVGNIRFDVLHTPGHTPEHVSFMITDTAASDQPIGIFTGDTLFVGDVGRPDLLETALGQMDTADKGGRQQYASIKRLAQLPDYLQIWPGHGAGSACGKALGAIPSTTLGYEKLVNPAFQQPDEDAFVDWLLDGQPETPPYFGQMKRVNRAGAPLLRTIPQAQHIRENPDNDIVPDDALFIDTRPRGDFALRHHPGTINIPISENSFPTYVGWYVNYDAPTFFIVYPNDVQAVLLALFSIGVDNVPGYFSPYVLRDATGAMQQMTPQQVHEKGLQVLDVRGAEERAAEHISGSQHIPMGQIPAELDSIPRDEPIAVQCGSGVRSGVVTSYLLAHGFEHVINMDGGIDGWKRAGLPLKQG